jgi:hypothetical protein
VSAARPRALTECQRIPARRTQGQEGRAAAEQERGAPCSRVLRSLLMNHTAERASPHWSANLVEHIRTVHFALL